MEVDDEDELTVTRRESEDVHPLHHPEQPEQSYEKHVEQ